MAKTMYPGMRASGDRLMIIIEVDANRQQGEIVALTWHSSNQCAKTCTAVPEVGHDHALRIEAKPLGIQPQHRLRIFHGETVSEA